MSGRDWQAFDAELRARVPELVVELLGKPTFRAGQEWRWGRKGSLSVVIAGPGAGMWFDHEAGEGGGLVDLVGRVRGLNRREALDWTADRIGMADEFGPSPRSAGRATRPSADTEVELLRTAVDANDACALRELLHGDCVVVVHVGIHDAAGEQINASHRWVFRQRPCQFDDVEGLAARIGIAAQLEILCPNQAVDTEEG